MDFGNKGGETLLPGVKVPDSPLLHALTYLVYCEDEFCELGQ